MKKPVLNPKYFSIAKYAVAVFAICLLMVVIVVRYEGLLVFLDDVITAIMPVIWGLVFAYLLNPLLNFYEKYAKKLFERKKKHPRLCRGVSATLTTITAIAVLAALVAIIIPQVADSLISIFKSAESYTLRAEEWLINVRDKYPEAYGILTSVFEELEMSVSDFAKKYSGQISNLATGATSVLKDFAIGLKDFLLGIIVMVYLLCGKENFKGQTKKIVYALFSENAANNIFRVTARADKTFIGFISGKVLDSFIIGLLCFISLRIMNMPFAVLISVIVGVTNVIPFFGPFFGAIPSAILVFFAAPEKTFIFIVFILILQQFDGNILGPKILGDSTGLPAFWVMFAIFIGGGLFGFVGMLIGVPVFAVIYELSKEYINGKLKKKNFPVTPLEYQSDKPVEKIEVQEPLAEETAEEPIIIVEEPKKENSSRRKNDRKK